MVGIKSCGVYVPIWRLDLQSIGKGRGERAIANFDEDSLTMGVAAAINCLRNIDRDTIDGLFFASSTSPFKEKQVSVTIATALDLRDDIITADFANSLRAGTNALRAAVDAVQAGRVKQVLVVASDMRLPMPGSDFERDLGDGAVALLVSSDPKVAIKSSYSVIEEIYDVWRSDEDKYIRTWEERFIMEEGYFKAMPRAVAGLLKENKLAAKDFAKVALSGPNSRRQAEVGRMMGFAGEQILAPIFGVVGDTGTASSLMMLASALGSAKPGDKLLLAHYGNGADALLLEVAEGINVSPSLQQCIDAKMVLKDYRRYLNWRGLLEMVTGRRRPPLPSPSVTCLWREASENIRLHAGKCRKCGMVQFPPQRVCFDCHSKDQFDGYRLSDKSAKLATYTEDYATPNPDPPLVLSVIDFDGGGRMWAYMTDRGNTEVQIGIPLGMTFRKLFTNEGVHNYYWKSMPLRFAKEAK